MRAVALAGLGALALPVLGLLALLVVVAGVLGGGSLGGGSTPAGAPGRPPAWVVALDATVASAPTSEASCAVPAPLLEAQQEVESGWTPSARSAAGAEGIAQFLPPTFAEYAHPVPPGGASPPSPWDPADAAWAESRYLCSLGIDRTVRAALIAYNCGSDSVVCQLASAGYAREIERLALALAARGAAP